MTKHNYSTAIQMIVQDIPGTGTHEFPYVATIPGPYGELITAIWTEIFSCHTFRAWWNPTATIGAQILQTRISQTKFELPSLD